MKIIIAGAGQIGTSLARYLRAENNDIVLIDTDIDKLGNLSEQWDIQTIEGSAAYPAVLDKAGGKDADIFIAVTGSDETNIVACGVAKSIFNIQTRIARISSSEYLSVKYKSFLKDQDINVVLSPEIETAHHLIQNLSVTSAVDLMDLVEGQVKLVGLRCKKNSPLIGKKKTGVTALAQGLNFQMLAVKRRHKLIPLNDVTLRVNDELYFIVDMRHLQQVLDTFAYQSVSPKYIVIFGGGRVGFQLAKLFEADKESQEVTVIEKDEDRAQFLAEKLSSTLVINGDGLDDTLVDELELANYQVAITTTQSDESNILLSLLAKRTGIERTCALIHNPLYDELLGGLGIDVTVSPNAVLVSAILQQIRKGRVHNDYFLQDGIGEVLEIEALKTAKITQKPLGRIRIPTGVVIGGIMRGDLFLLPSKDLIVQEKDIVILFVERGRVREAEKLFTVGFNFF